MEVLKVSANSSPNSVAGAVASVVKRGGAVEVQAIGAGAVNQAVKAIAIARGFVVSTGREIVAIPSFVDVEIDGKNKTAIKLLVKDFKF